eukprot:CAMPEP_0178842452 /NCGR_PEP_ID=MMETSP0746-20121128/15521_1 /TAXON_ID=913974 /ORGANISM="Nitzschia punctata, Strain CCMP561" /LENGTH=261 /DNA_ID=CAMNT_0020505801 /DNA_START=21 /DNA_END=806 /DNA_ORIENTATION=+
MDTLTEEEKKRRMAGVCCYNMLGLVATAAFICATYSYAYCDFASRYVELTPGTTVEDVCSGLGNGFQSSCETLLQDGHGVGFEGFWVTIPVDTQICLDYTQLTPWGYVTPDFDTKFNSARALSICGIIFGGAGWFSLMFAACCPMDQAKLKGLACYFFLATLFQGLSLLMFRSNVCSTGFFDVYFTDPSTGEPSLPSGAIQSVTCGLASGSKLAISATVLWFVCNNMIPAAIVPGQLWAGGEQPTPGMGQPQYQENAEGEA